MWSHLGGCQALGTDDKPANAGMVWKAQASDELLRRGCNSSCLACAFEVVRPSDCVMSCECLSRYRNSTVPVSHNHRWPTPKSDQARNNQAHLVTRANRGASDKPSTYHRPASPGAPMP